VNVHQNEDIEEILQQKEEVDNRLDRAEGDSKKRHPAFDRIGQDWMIFRAR